MGFTPQFISSEEIEAGQLKSAASAALILPSAYALSDRETTEITAFVENPKAAGVTRAIFCDGVPGVFDEHGKLRNRSALEKFLPTSATPTSISSRQGAGMFATGPGDIAGYASERLSSSPPSDIPDWLQKQLGSLRPEIMVSSSARVRVHRFRAGGTELLAFERNVDYQMSEDLKQPGGNEALEKPIVIEATLPRAAYIFDLRAQSYFGHGDRLHFTLDPWKPSLLRPSPGKNLPRGNNRRHPRARTGRPQSDSVRFLPRSMTSDTCHRYFANL